MLNFNRKIISNGYEVTILTDEVKAHKDEEFGCRFCLCQGMLYVICHNGVMFWANPDTTVDKRTAVNAPLNLVSKGDTIEESYGIHRTKWQVVHMDETEGFIWGKNGIVEKLIEIEKSTYNGKKIDGFKS